MLLYIWVDIAWYLLLSVDAAKIPLKNSWYYCCGNGRTEIAQLIIQSSNDFDIDLNTKDNHGTTALHAACYFGNLEIVQIIMQNWKEFGIYIKVQDNEGKTSLDLSKNHEGEGWNQIMEMLENEYSQIDVT